MGRTKADTRGLVVAALLLPTVLFAFAPAVRANSLVSGYWVITQAASQSQGQAAKVVACGQLTLASTATSANTFVGTMSFDLTNSSPNGLSDLFIPGINGTAEAVSGSVLTPPIGLLFVSFGGNSPVPLSGSFTSPSSKPSPSIDPTLLAGCQAFPAVGFLGLVHLPMQGTEGMTIYGDPVTTFP